MRSQVRHDWTTKHAHTILYYNNVHITVKILAVAALATQLLSTFFFFSCYRQFGQGSWLKAFHFLAVGSIDSNNLFWPVSPCYRDLLTFTVTGLGMFM